MSVKRDCGYKLDSYSTVMKRSDFACMQVNFLKRSNLSSALKVAICTRSLLGKQLHLDSCPVKHHIRNIEFLAVLDGDASLHAAAIANALVDPSDCQ